MGGLLARMMLMFWTIVAMRQSFAAREIRDKQQMVSKDFIVM